MFLVTGAAGFIGSALSKRLIELGHKVVTVDNLSTGFVENIPNEVIFVKGDCHDKSLIKSLDKYSFDAIFHIAGQSSGEISFDDPVYDLQTNAESTLLLLKLALKVKCKKFIYASTMSVYGDQGETLVKEDSSLNPKSFYGVGKLASEKYLSIFQNFGINCTALRLFNVYGPGQNMYNLRQGMVSIFLAQAFNHNEINVKGSKDRFRDFIFIDDVVNAFISSYNKEKISFSNKISPSGLLPIFPNSFKPFSIVVLGIIVLAKTIGFSLPYKITSLILISSLAILRNKISSSVASDNSS